MESTDDIAEPRGGQPIKIREEVEICRGVPGFECQPRQPQRPRHQASSVEFVILRLIFFINVR